MKSPEFNLKIFIYEKPPATDCIIPCNSCHPITHKLTAVRYRNNRLNTYNLHPHDRENKEKIVI